MCTLIQFAVSRRYSLALGVMVLCAIRTVGQQSRMQRAVQEPVLSLQSIQRVTIVIGARPQYMKVAPILSELSRSHIVVNLIDTGQHFEDSMSKVFFDDLKIPVPQKILNIHGGSQLGQIGLLLPALTSELVKSKTDAVVVFGDTNAAPAAAMVAAASDLPVIHIEAGMRSFRRSQPEEINRVIADHLSSVLFASSKASYDNLVREGLSSALCLSGDVQKDSFLTIMKSLTDLPASGIASILDHACQNSNCRNGGYALVTMHRPSNTDVLDVFRMWIQTVSNAHEGLIVWVTHPRIRKHLKHVARPSNVIFLDPVSYRTSVALLINADIVLTDSGGLQREAYWAMRKTVTMRKETEWTETLEGDWNCLAPSPVALPFCIQKTPNAKLWNPHLYGSGCAARRIVRTLLSGICASEERPVGCS